jgi:Na+/melibiose symporter-like transporter
MLILMLILSTIIRAFFLVYTLYGSHESAAMEALALVPLTLYLSSFAATFPLEWLTKKLGRKATYALGACGERWWWWGW